MKTYNNFQLDWNINNVSDFNEALDIFDSWAESGTAKMSRSRMLSRIRILRSMTNFPVATSAESARLSATDTPTICTVVLFVAAIRVLLRPITKYN